MQIGIYVDALYNEYLRLRLVLPTLNKEQTEDKIWVEHFRQNHISDELI
jgi:hypothetical protein